MAVPAYGRIVTDWEGKWDQALGVSTQPDGKIIIVGTSSVGSNYSFTVARYNVDGTLDTTFNGTGQLVAPLPASNAWAWATTVQPDGKILVVGSMAAASVIARYNPDGTPDTSFAGTGYVTSLFTQFGFDVALQPDGAIVIAGLQSGTSTEMAVARYNADGTRDSTFNGSGRTLIDVAGGADMAKAVEVQADGKIVVLGHASVNGVQLLVATRLNANGTVDTSFNKTGTYVTSLVPSGTTSGGLALQADGKILIGGVGYSTSADYALLRLNADGTPDTGFGKNGIVLADAGTGLADVLGHIAVQPDGKILVAGSTALGGMDWDFSVVRFNSDGSLDKSFNGTGRVLTDIAQSSEDFAYNLAVQADGRIVVVGSSNASGTSDFAMVRYNADGSLDQSLGAPPAPPPPPPPPPEPKVLTGTPIADTLTGAGGDDTLIGLAGVDRLDGQQGSDLYVIASVNDHKAGEIADSGSTGIDEVRLATTATTGTLKLFASDTGIELVTISTPTGSLGIDASPVLNSIRIVGNAGANSLVGTVFRDTLDGGAGADRLTGGAGDDTYIVDNERDVITEASATGGHDTVWASVTHTLGTNVEDLVLTGTAAANGIGNALANSIIGNAAANVINGKAGLDSLDGGEGSDTYILSLASDHPGAEFADSGTSGVDEVRFSATSASTLKLFAGDTGIERITLGASGATVALSIDASAVGNALSITGNAGANVLVGTAFADTLDGGSGKDVLAGGAGADRFVFASALSTTANKDTLTDFESGSDVLQLSRSVFKGFAAVGAIAAGQFWSGPGVNRAHDADDRIIYDTTTGTLYYDADGIGAGASVQIAVIGIGSHPAVAAADFEVIA